MLYYTILYYTILYYTILYYTILYYTILYYTILYYTILYYTILYYTILYYTILYYTILYYTILYYTILYYTMLLCSIFQLFGVYCRVPKSLLFVPASPDSLEDHRMAQRVHVPNTSGLRSQRPLRVWFLGPESLNVGYLDPLGGGPTVP